MKLEFKIFENYFTARDSRQDPNKNSQGAGTLQRYMEVFGHDIDANVTPLITDMVSKVIDPYTAEDKYIQYMSSFWGYDERNRTLYMGEDPAMQRALVKIMPRLLGIRRSKQALTLLFGMLGMTYVGIEEDLVSHGFDSGTTLDSDTRRLDSYETDYTSFGIVLDAPEGTILTDDLMEIIRSIVAFNMPINARWDYLIFNGDRITGVNPDFNADYNRDYAT